MNERTVKLSGHVKDRFLERFFADEQGLDAQTRLRLVKRSQSTFSSLRVRKAALARPRIQLPPVSASSPVTDAKTGTRTEPETKAGPVTVAPPAPAPPPATAEDAAPFDPYAFGLVPIFQREGAEGLLARLGAVADIAHLRQMAKAQQIVLPQELRAGEATTDAIRAGIVEAVAKRIKDRRAAAG